MLSGARCLGMSYGRKAAWSFYLVVGRHLLTAYHKFDELFPSFASNFSRDCWFARSWGRGWLDVPLWASMPRRLGTS